MYLKVCFLPNVLQNKLSLLYVIICFDRNHPHLSNVNSYRKELFVLKFQ